MPFTPAVAYEYALFSTARPAYSKARDMTPTCYGSLRRAIELYVSFARGTSPTQSLTNNGLVVDTPPSADTAMSTNNVTRVAVG